MTDRDQGLEERRIENRESRCASLCQCHDRRGAARGVRVCHPGSLLRAGESFPLRAVREPLLLLSPARLHWHAQIRQGSSVPFIMPLSAMAPSLSASANLVATSDADGAETPTPADSR